LGGVELSGAKRFCLVLLGLGWIFVTARGDDFAEAIQALSELKCAECHSAEEKRGGLDLAGLSRDLADPAIEAEWTYIFDRVRRNEMPPPKKARPEAARRDAFLASLGTVLSRHDADRRAKNGRVVWRRLNRVEYENTVRDLLGIDAWLADLLPEDRETHGFDNVAEGSRLSAHHVESYLAAGAAALEAAIQLGEAPKVRKQRFNYLEMPGIKVRLARIHGRMDKTGHRYEQVYRALPDAFVMFSDEPGGVAALPESQAPVAGVYRVRLSAHAYQGSGRPVTLKLRASRYTSQRPVAAFDLPDDRPREAEALVRLEKGEFIDLGAEGCGVALDGSNVWEVGAERFKGPGIAIQWVEIEGPLRFQWPPPSVARVFGDVPVKPLEHPRGERAYELVPAHPEVDVRRALQRFAERAFRRPATDAETARYVRLAEQALAEGAGFEQAVRRGCAAILASPEFLFLREQPGRLDDHALASRLSYFLWSTMPDDELLRLAAAGELHDPAVLRAQTERLLDSPRARAFTRNFCGQWLGLRDIDTTFPDKVLYPEFDGELRQAMVQETELFFEELLRSDLGVSVLIDSDFAVLNRRLADHYHIPGVYGGQFRKVSLPEGSHRGGILAHASVLKVTANGSWSSPVMRGAWVVKRILGRTLNPPPPGVGSIEPDTRGATTIREQLEKHRRSPSCAACHQYIDPPGLALESFDVIGGWRDWYRTSGQGRPLSDPVTGKRLSYRQGLAVETGGELADGRRFGDFDDYKRLLLDQRDEIARNLAELLVTYATGATVTFSDRAAVQEILRRARSRSYGLRTLVHEVVQSPVFQTK
jgi:hypothetical protein